MSETLTAVRIPTVYFIDDSATMREVIKIAFRKENIHVITCPDAASALQQFGETAPDAIITDVIMPDKDGYEVCQFIKQHEQYAHTPVILMSGVVNKSVAERAMSVKADDLIRKPFQPQDLIGRVKNLLHPKSADPSVTENSAGDSAPAAPRTPPALNSLFYTGPSPAAAPGSVAPRPSAPPAARTPARPAPPPASGPRAADAHKLRNDILRLELLVKRLQAELEAKTQYCAALEAHIKSLQESE